MSWFWYASKPSTMSGSLIRRTPPGLRMRWSSVRIFSMSWNSVICTAVGHDDEKRVVSEEFGAADVSGAGAAIGAVTQLGPLVTVLVVAGAGSTAICADLGARTIREEIDALEVLGIDPIHRLVVPRVVASTFVALLLNGAVVTIGLVGGFVFGVYLQNVSAGAYVSTLTLITGLPEVLISVIKATVFGLIAGLVGCYRGLTVSGGAKGVGTAVNETLVLCVIALFAVNVVLTTIGVKFGTGS